MIPTEPYAYLKEHIGCMYSIAENGKHKRKWRNGEVLKQSDLWDCSINCCQELPNEITLESDYKDSEQYKNKENQDHAEGILKQAGCGYYISSHNGKSDYLRFRFKTSKEITPQLRLAIIRYLSKPDLKFDEAFFSLKYVRPIPARKHWKHSKEIERIIKIVQGEDLDIDKLGIVEPVKPLKIKVNSGSMPNIKMQPMGWACSINIKVMAQRFNLLNCPKCNTAFYFNETLGQFKCLQCGDFGGLKIFATMCKNKKLISVTQ